MTTQYGRRLWLEYGVYFLLCQLLEMFLDPEEIQIEKKHNWTRWN